MFVWCLFGCVAAEIIHEIRGCQVGVGAKNDARTWRHPSPSKNFEK
jgi:hypothetical protein